MKAVVRIPLTVGEGGGHGSHGSGPGIMEIALLLGAAGVGFSSGYAAARRVRQRRSLKGNTGGQLRDCFKIALLTCFQLVTPETRFSSNGHRLSMAVYILLLQHEVMVA